MQTHHDLSPLGMWFHRLAICTFAVVPVLWVIGAPAGEWPRELHVYAGTAPTLDGVLSEGEYDDAVSFSGVEGWAPQFNPTADPEDLSLEGWAKHDGTKLYFAFSVTDDVLYGIDTDRWLPDENPPAHALTPEGYPWFGDGIELLVNASDRWSEEDGENNSGDGSSWQMVCNLTKSRLGGIGVGGLLEGERRSDPHAWKTYGAWIGSGAMRAVARPKESGKGFVVEWEMEANPCLEIEPGRFWSPDLGIVRMGFNMTVQDLDEKARGEGNFGNFNHEDWWAGEKDKRTWKKQWGTLIVHPGPKPTEIHVSTKGDDKNPGTADAPVATIQRARDLIRKFVKKGLDRDLLVILREGTYELDNTLLLTPEDSGTERYSISYTNYPGYEYPGEKVTVSGGRPLSGWKRKNGVTWSLHVPEVENGEWWFRQLFRDNTRLPRSRYPNGDEMLTVDSVSQDLRTLGLRQTLPEFDSSNQDVELVVLQNWSISRALVEDVNSNRAVVAKTPLGWVGHSGGAGGTVTQPGKAAFLEHAKEFADEPGEWYLDCQSGELLVGAGEEEDLSDATMVAPKLERLLAVEGSAASPVRNVHFRGLVFAYAEWPLPEFGYRGIQAGYYGTSEEPREPAFCQPAAMEFRHAHNCSVSLCRVKHTGASGVGLGAGCRDTRIVGNEFFDVGCNAIHIGHRTEALLGENILDADWPDLDLVPSHNEASDNYVHECAATSYGGVGIFDAFTQHSKISHNLVSDLPYTGISVGFKWSTDPTSQQDCLVENNHICNVMGKLIDGGGVYTLGLQPETVLRGNLIHDVLRPPFAPHPPEDQNNGIFFDQGSKGFLVEGNVIFGTVGEALRFNQCDRAWHTWNDNLLGVGPTDVRFPWFPAAQAGIEPAYRMKVLGR